MAKKLTKVQFSQKVEEIVALKMQVKLLEEQIDAAQSAVKEYMGDKEELVTAAGRNVFYKKTTAARIDTDRFRKENPGIAQLYEVSSQYRALRIK